MKIDNNIPNNLYHLNQIKNQVNHINQRLNVSNSKSTVSMAGKSRFYDFYQVYDEELNKSYYTDNGHSIFAFTKEYFTLKTEQIDFKIGDSQIAENALEKAYNDVVRSKANAIATQINKIGFSHAYSVRESYKQYYSKVSQKLVYGLENRITRLFKQAKIYYKNEESFNGINLELAGVKYTDTDNIPLAVKDINNYFSKRYYKIDNNRSLISELNKKLNSYQFGDFTKSIFDKLSL